MNFRLKKICVCNLSAHRVHIAFVRWPDKNVPLAAVDQDPFAEVGYTKIIRFLELSQLEISDR